MNTMTISRRKFAQLLGIGAATVVVRPPVSFAKPTQSVTTPLMEGGSVVRLSANENPYGPCPKALQAITDSFGLACRYPDEHNNVLIDKLAKLNSVTHDQVLLDGVEVVILVPVRVRTEGSVSDAADVQLPIADEELAADNGARPAQRHRGDH